MALRLLTHSVHRLLVRLVPYVFYREGDMPRAPRPNMPGRLAVLVLGPEGSGTRLVTRILNANGLWGDVEHEQRLDSLDPALLEHPARIVWRRSLPHDEDWPDLERMYAFLEEFDVRVVVTLRAWDIMIEQHVRAGHARDRPSAEARAQEACQRIFDFLGRHRLPYAILSYEALVAYPAREQDWLLSWLGLDSRKHLSISDRNRQYLQA